MTPSSPSSAAMMAPIRISEASIWRLPAMSSVRRPNRSMTNMNTTVDAV